MTSREKAQKQTELTYVCQITAFYWRYYDFFSETKSTTLFLVPDSLPTNIKYLWSYFSITPQNKKQLSWL